MGLFVGGTGSANQLEDYEEGTVTLQLETHSDKTNVSTSGNTTLDITGNYVKVGQYCMVTGLFNNLNNTNDRRDHVVFRVNGLPFASYSGTGADTQTAPLGYNRGVYALYNQSRIDDDIVSFYYWCASGGTICFTQASQSNGPGTLFFAISDNTSSQYIAFQFGYRTN